MDRNIKKAPSGHFRVVGFDSSRDTGWKKEDHPSLAAAKQAIKPPGHSTIRFRVYDDKGECVHGNGFRHVV